MRTLNDQHVHWSPFGASQDKGFAKLDSFFSEPEPDVEGSDRTDQEMQRLQVGLGLNGDSKYRVLSIAWQCLVTFAYPRWSESRNLFNSNYRPLSAVHSSKSWWFGGR